MSALHRIFRTATVLAVCLSTASAPAVEYYFTGTGLANNDWWATADNWSPNGNPGASAANGDVAIFDQSWSSRNTTNTHTPHHYLQELRFNTNDSWRLHNSVWDVYLDNPNPGNALFTQNGSGPVTLDCDLRFDDDTVFGGTGSGQVTIKGSVTAQHATYGPRNGTFGTAGLILNGNYTLALENVAGYQGPTTINAGTLLFNAESAIVNPNWQTEPGTPWIPTTMAPVTVNSGGTLGGTGILRAPVTVNSGGTFSPGVSPGVFTVDSLTLAGGSNTLVELGGATPGNGSGYHDQTNVTGQLSLGGTLNVDLTGSYAPTALTTYTIFNYGSLDPGADSFDTVNFPSYIPAAHPNWSWAIDYGTGTSSQVTVGLESNPWYFTGGAYDLSYVSPGPSEPANQPWWAIRANWNYDGTPGSDTANPDVVIFDDAYLNPHAPASHQTNIHAVNPGYVKELRVNTSSSWWFYNNSRTLAMKNAAAGQPALFTQNGPGTVVVDSNLRLDSDTVFGGTGSGKVTVNGQQAAVHATLGPRPGVFGTGGLILDGNYTLEINNVVSYQGTTTVNSGATLLFNAETVVTNPAWVEADPSTYYLPGTQGAVTVNSGGTLGGTGVLRAPVTVNSGGIFAPGASEGVLTVDSLTLLPGSTTRMELGGTTPGTGAGHHDQAVVGGALSLAGTLDLAVTSGYLPGHGDRLAIFEYGSLAGTFDALNSPSIPARPTVQFSIDYGTGAGSQVTVIADAQPYYFTGTGAANNDWWVTQDNWSPNGEPGTSAAFGDAVVFDESYSPTRNTTNTHDKHHSVRELRFNTSGSWRLHNSVWDVYLNHPVAGENALFTQNGSGPVTLDCDLRFDDDTVFGGTGSGQVTIKGSVTAEHATYGPRNGTFGTGGLILNGDYTLALENVAGYQGPTTINAGTLLFNAESAVVNPNWQTEPGTPWIPTTMAPVTVNSGGTLGGTGVLRAPVTINSGGTFSPGVSPGVFAVDSLTLAAGSNTLVELGGATPGNGSGYHDQTNVTGQLSLGGTLNVDLTGSYTPTALTTYTIFNYGSLDPGADSFDTVNLPSYIPAAHPNWYWEIDYGTGTSSQVKVSLESNPWYFTAGAYDSGVNNPWWATADNWSYDGKPGFSSSYPDVVIFDDAHYSAAAMAALGNHQTNVHDVNPGWLEEIQVNTASSWWFYNNNRTLAMKNAEAGQPARFTQNSTGTVLVDSNLRLDSDTVFGGTGTGTVTVNGQQQECNSSSGPRPGIFGAGGLTLDGAYTLVINNVASYQGATVINQGTLLFNADSAQVASGWVYGDPASYYTPVALGDVAVNSGGTLGGTGSLMAEVTVAADGILAPGAAGTGIFTLGGLTLEPGSEALFEIGGTAPGEGTGFHDQVIVGDPFGLGLSGTLALGGTLTLEFLDGFEPEVGDYFVLFEYDILDPAHSAFDAIAFPQGFVGGFGLDYGTGTNSQVVLTAVPEPATATLLLAALAAFCLWLFQRRRRVA